MKSCTYRALYRILRVPWDGSVTAADRPADRLTSCAGARPEGRAGCVSAHVRICAGPPGKPGGYRDENRTSRLSGGRRLALKAQYFGAPPPTRQYIITMHTPLFAMPRATTFSTQAITVLIRERIVVTLPDLQAALGPVGERTARYKLAAAGCRSSYSHNGRYYTLDELADYDAHGVWSYGDIRFSQHGPLTATIAALVNQAHAGLFARDLKQMVKLDMLPTLSKLAQEGRVSRVKVEDRYLYCSSDTATRRRQRRNHTRPPAITDPTFLSAEQSLLEILDERQRRLYAGLESLRPDSGSDPEVAGRPGMSRSTVIRGRKQLLSGEFERHRVRKPGGGRKRVKKNDSLNTLLEQIVDCDTAGDPSSGLRWTRRTTQAIALALQEYGIIISDRTVCRLLKSQGYALRVNHKKLAGVAHPDRNQQFALIASIRTRAARMDLPLSVWIPRKRSSSGAFAMPAHAGGAHQN